MLATETFHVVRHRTSVGLAMVTQTFSIYADNKPFLKPPKGQRLTKREAQWIADLLNHGKIKRGR